MSNDRKGRLACHHEISRSLGTEKRGHRVLMHEAQRGQSALNGSTQMIERRGILPTLGGLAGILSDGDGHKRLGDFTFADDAGGDAERFRKILNPVRDREMCGSARYAGADDDALFDVTVKTVRLLQVGQVTLEAQPEVVDDVRIAKTRVPQKTFAVDAVQVKPVSRFERGNVHGTAITDESNRAGRDIAPQPYDRGVR